MRQSANCPISGNKDALIGFDGEFVEYDCPVCGRFKIGRAALELASDEDQGLLREALQVAKHAADAGEVPAISNLSG